MNRHVSGLLVGCCLFFLLAVCLPESANAIDARSKVRSIVNKTFASAKTSQPATDNDDQDVSPSELLYDDEEVEEAKDKECCKCRSRCGRLRGLFRKGRRCKNDECKQ